MDPGREATPTSPPPEGTTRPLDRPLDQANRHISRPSLETAPVNSPPLETIRHSDPTLDRPSELGCGIGHPSFRHQEGEHTMEVDDVPRPSQSTEDTQHEAKKARWQKLMTAKRRPPRIDFSPPRWVKSGYNMQTGEDSEKKQRARIVGAAIREQLKRVNRYTPYIELPVEVVPPRSNKPPVEYCMSDEFIQHLDRQAKLYFSRVKQPSRKEIVANGLEYMTQEAFSAFTDYVVEKDPLQGLEYKFGKLLHHCFSVEEHAKVYTHYNFTIETKKNDGDCWTSSIYFAEAKLMDGFKYYFCSPVNSTDNGDCYACQNQGVNELKHPPGGGYQKGHEGSGFCYMNADSSSDEELA